MRYKLHIRCNIGCLINPDDENDVEYGVRLELTGIPTQEQAEAVDQWLRSIVTTNAHEIEGAVLQDWELMPEEGKPS